MVVYKYKSVVLSGLIPQVYQRTGCRLQQVHPRHSEDGAAQTRRPEVGAVYTEEQDEQS